MPSAVRLLAFAGARDLLGSGEFALEVATPCTSAALLEEVCRRFPALVSYRASIRVAVNGRYVTAEDVVADGDEVALIPPVAGG